MRTSAGDHAGAGAAGLALACVLILAERAGKALRSPAKSALLAEVARQVGRGRGFGVHKFMDEVGAFAGPVLVAGIVGARRTPVPAAGRPGVARGGWLGVVRWVGGRGPAPGRAPRGALGTGRVAR